MLCIPGDYYDDVESSGARSGGKYSTSTFKTDLWPRILVTCTWHVAPEVVTCESFRWLGSVCWCRWHSTVLDCLRSRAEVLRQEQQDEVRAETQCRVSHRDGDLETRVTTVTWSQCSGDSWWSGTLHMTWSSDSVPADAGACVPAY